MDINYSVLVAVGVLLAILILCILLLRSSNQSPNVDELPCKAGQCAINLYNGEKRCPPNSAGIVSARATVEICGGKYVCDNPALPYAVDTNGGTNTTKVCEEGIACRCLAGRKCPNYVEALWVTETGNPHLALSGQNVTFTQVAKVNGAIDYSGETSFCSVPISWVARSIPGCTFLTEVTAPGVSACMTGPSSCPEIPQTFPCIAGTLAFVSETDSYTLSNPVACVTGKACGCGTIAVYNVSSGMLVCLPQ